MRKTTSGFTIVELLIVIVVIGILAAITVTAYSGIQQRAKNITTINGVKQYQKALALYAVDKGSYPNILSCLGDGYSYPSNPGSCAGASSVYTQSSFNTALAPYLSALPRLDTTNITIYTANIRAGAYYDPAVGTYGTIYYMLAGTTATCDVGGSKNLSSNPGVTGFFCAYSMPAP